MIATNSSPKGVKSVWPVSGKYSGPAGVSSTGGGVPWGGGVVSGGGVKVGVVVSDGGVSVGVAAVGVGVGEGVSVGVGVKPSSGRAAPVLTFKAIQPPHTRIARPR
jgi:hypothetical protein